MQGLRREVILGVGGGIAAYKSCDLLRRLLDADFQVTVVPTPSSLNFVGKATWEALSGRSVTTEVFQSVEEVRHVSLAKSADFLIIAPATADLMARLAVGRADDLLTNVVLASDVPTLIVPAMHPQMWNNAATAENVKTLRSRGYTVLDPEIGALTSGDVGQGRFPATETILKAFAHVIGNSQDLLGRRILVTAGGTREPLDPVRYIGNRSSGKQGYAIARAAKDRGADVTLISANVSLPDIPGIKTIKVETAEEMAKLLEHEFTKTDVLVMSAAVADAKPLQQSAEKIKKHDLSSIELIENPDLLASISVSKKSQIIVAFAAETSLDTRAAQEKLERKGADILYLNDVSTGEIFNSETTQGQILLQGGAVINVAKTTKDTLANQLLSEALHKLG
jgi:phosphopantothenoylcysteine decarboxylase/phosphopantothenate--cysteine ligase